MTPESQPEASTTPTPSQEQPSLQPTPKTPTSGPKKGVIVAIIIGFILLIVGGGIYAYTATQQSHQSSASSLTASHDGNIATTQEENSIASAAEKIAPSVVSIVTESQVRSFYGTTAQEGAGTGIIVSNDGYIMTNNHVVNGATNVLVVDSTGETYEKVAIVGRDPLNDIAFLKINSRKTDFKAAELGNSSSLRIGQQVVAVGNALGQYSNTVTSGIVSGTGRPVTAQSEGGETESLTDLIQTDASINPGNSGGPLVNMSGQVIGINTAIAAEANGIGFAIPINATKGVLAGVLETGKVERAFLGVNYLSITPEIAREYNLPVKDGAYIYSDRGNPVASDSPAAKAGLKNEMIITKINDFAIGKQGSLSSIIGQYRPGDSVTITYLENGREKTTQLTLGSYNE